MVGDNAPKPDWWDVDPHDWPTTTLSAPDYDRLMAELDRPGVINVPLLRAARERRERPPSNVTLGEN